MTETIIRFDDEEKNEIIGALKYTILSHPEDAPRLEKIIFHLKEEKPTTVPDSIKEDNWRLFEQAMSADPAFAAQYSLKWVTHLMITMDIAGIRQYDDKLKRALEKARIALADYTDLIDPQHEGKSLQGVSEVIQLVGFLMYDPEERFATRDKNAFTGR